MKQLELFNYEAVKSEKDGDTQPAAVIVFPQGRRIGKVRHVAALALKRQGAAQNAYWYQVCNSLAGTLAGAGVDREEIARQIAAFKIAVEIEMGRQMLPGRRQGTEASR